MIKNLKFFLVVTVLFGMIACSNEEDLRMDNPAFENIDDLNDEQTSFSIENRPVLELFNYPLDHEIVRTGDYYHDPALYDNAYTWQYAVVKPGYQPPQGIAYEVLEELFIIEHSDGYTEETISGEAAQTKSTGSGRKASINGDLRKALVAISFVLTGNGGELRTDNPGSSDDPQTRRTVTNCRRMGICQHPQGLLAYIKQFYPVHHNNQRSIESSRLHFLQRLLQIADNRLLENRRVPNGTHGGVRGRKTKAGRKLLRFPPTRLQI